MAIEIKAPYNVFFGEDGYPLEGGYIYIGQYGLNPLSNPQTAYWDEALATPAVDVRTSGGMPSYNGTVGKLYVLANYSILVQDKLHRTIYLQLNVKFDQEDLLLTVPDSTLLRGARAPSSFSFNNILDSGFYVWTNGATTNQPTGCSAGDMFVLQAIASSAGTGTIVQTVADLTGGHRVYTRKSMDAGVTWSDWIVVTLDAAYLFITAAATLASKSIIDAPGEVMTLPESMSVGTSFEVYCRQACRIVQSHAEAGISYKGKYSTSKGVYDSTVGAEKGYVQTKPNDKLQLTYVGAGLSRLAQAEPMLSPVLNPSSGAVQLAISPSGQYVATGHGTSPWIIIYKWIDGVLTALPAPASVPPSTSYCAAFSPDENYLAVGHNLTPFITIYKRSGDTFTKLADPASLPTGIGNGIMFSPNGRFLAIAHIASPYITIYERSGDTFTKLADPAGLPTGVGKRVAFSPDSRLLAVAHTTTPFITIYRWSGTAFVKLAASVTTPAGNGNDVAFSPDGNFMAVAHDASPYLTIYAIAEDVFTKTVSPATVLTANGQAVAFSPDGHTLIAGGGILAFYDYIGDAFSRVSGPVIDPGTAWSIAFAPDNSYFLMTHLGSPTILVYKLMETITHAWIIDELHTKFSTDIPNMFK